MKITIDKIAITTLATRFQLILTPELQAESSQLLEFYDALANSGIQCDFRDLEQNGLKSLQLPLESGSDKLEQKTEAVVKNKLTDSKKNRKVSKK